jgi:hypothetical protein
VTSLDSEAIQKADLVKSWLDLGSQGRVVSSSRNLPGKLMLTAFPPSYQSYRQSNASRSHPANKHFRDITISKTQFGVQGQSNCL